MSKLHIFDMDGTLLRGSACLELSRHLGQLEAVNDIEERWSRGEIGHFDFWVECLPLWAGLDDAGVDAAFAATSWIRGIEAVWADIADRGEASAVITQSPQFFADRLLAWGVGSAHGALVHAGVAPEPTQVITPEDKLRIARELMERHGVGPQDTVAYGDSSSDVPLFRTLPNTVAVNASPTLRELAAAHYEGDDLWGAYEAGRSLIDPVEKAAKSWR